LVTSLDSIIDAVCENAGADFAFVLSRKGRLVTKRAPQDMPEAGRLVLVQAAEALLAGGAMPAVVELPRQALVPFGGAAPVDVYVAARQEAILCVVMATYAPKDAVAQALGDGLDDVDDLLAVESERRARRRGGKPKAAKSSSGSRSPGMPSSRPPGRPPTIRPGPSSKGSSRGRGKSVAPPPQMDFDESSPRATLPMLSPKSSVRRKTPPPPPPEISVGEAPIGRATMAAIDVDASGPDISYGFAPIGRHTIAEIELEAVPKGDARSSAPKVEVRLATMPEIDAQDFDPTDRQTLPFTETPSDAKRSFETAGEGKARVIENTARRSVVVGASAPRAPQRKGPPPLPTGASSDAAATAAPAVPAPSREAAASTAAQPDARLAHAADDAPAIEIAHDKTLEIPTEIPAEELVRPRNPRDSSLTAWHRALTEIVDPATRGKRTGRK
jgi:hypothetical protein